MKINLAVRGKFHYHNYVKYLDSEKILNKFYYSHKLSTNSKYLQVSASKLENVWLSEYLLRGFLKLLKNNYWDYYYPLSGYIWEHVTIKKWEPCDILHVLLDGMALKLISQEKAKTPIIIGEPVNCHPIYMNQLLNEENALHGIRKKLEISKHKKSLLQEIGQTNYLLVGSNFIKNSYIKFGYNADRIFTIPYGIDLSKFYRSNEMPIEERFDKQKKFRVICVGQISLRKGQLYLLEAWKNLKLPNSELILVGAVNPELEKVLKNYNELFTHYERISNEELKNYYCQSDLCVLPSIEDGFGIVVTEALACGLPVIVTTNTGAADVIEPGKNGFIIPIRSWESIAQILETLYIDKSLRYNMSICALEKANSSLSWEIYSNKLIDLYKSLYADYRL